MENAFVGNCSEAFWNLGLTNLCAKWCRWCWFMIAITCWLSSGHQCIMPPSCDLHLFFWSWTRTFAWGKNMVNRNLTSGVDMWRLFRKHFWGNLLKGNYTCWKLKLPHLQNEFLFERLLVATISTVLREYNQKNVLLVLIQGVHDVQPISPVCVKSP